MTSGCNCSKPSFLVAHRGYARYKRLSFRREVEDEKRRLSVNMDFCSHGNVLVVGWEGLGPL